MGRRLRRMSLLTAISAGFALGWNLNGEYDSADAHSGAEESLPASTRSNLVAEPPSRHLSAVAPKKASQNLTPKKSTRLLDLPEEEQKKAIHQLPLEVLRQAFFKKSAEFYSRNIKEKFPVKKYEEEIEEQIQKGLDSIAPLLNRSPYWLAETSLEIQGQEQPLKILFHPWKTEGQDISAQKSSNLCTEIEFHFPELENGVSSTMWMSCLNSLTEKEGRFFQQVQFQNETVLKEYSYFSVELPQDLIRETQLEILSSKTETWNRHHSRLHWYPISQEEVDQLKALEKN